MYDLVHKMFTLCGSSGPSYDKEAKLRYKKYEREYLVINIDN
jgi:hypothetical protein